MKHINNTRKWAVLPNPGEALSHTLKTLENILEKDFVAVTRESMRNMILKYWLMCFSEAEVGVIHHRSIFKGLEALAED